MNRWTLAVLAFVLLPTWTAHADLDEAKRLKDQLKYREAYRALTAALEVGDASAAELGQMHRLGGELLAGLDDTDGATVHFAHYLAIEPTGALDAGASPKLTAPFEAARIRVAGQRLAASHSVTENSLEVVVIDPSKLVRAVRAELGTGESIQTSGSSPYRIGLPAVRPLRLVAYVVDEHGNRIAQLGRKDAPLVIDGKTDGKIDGQRPPIVSKPPLYRRPTTWATTAGVSGLVTTSLALLARRAQSDLDDLNRQARDDPFSVSFDDIRSVEKRGRRYALATNIGIGVTSAAAIAVLATWLLDDGDGRDKALEPTVSIMDEGSLTVGARVRF